MIGAFDLDGSKYYVVNNPNSNGSIITSNFSGALSLNKINDADIGISPKQRDMSLSGLYPSYNIQYN